MANVWQKAFQRIFWKNRPDTSSPLGESKLLPMDASIDTIDDRVVTLQSTKAEQSDFLTALKNIQYNPSTGVFTITKFNDSSFTIDTDIEKIAINFDYDDDPTSAHYQQLIITLDDGTVKYVDLSALITEYEFGNTSTINFTVSGSTGIVTANIINGSITSDHLAPSVTAAINAAVNSAEAHAEDSEAWARGTKDGTPVPSTADQYQNNSKYYSELSDGSAEDSEAYAKGTRNGTAVPSTDPTYHNNSKYYAEQAEASLNNTVRSFNGRTGAVSPTSGDYDISDMGDVSITSPTDGQGLRYNAQSGKWENGDAASAVSNLTDVDLNNLSNGQVLKYNGTSEKWENKEDSAGHTIQNTSGTNLTQRSTMQFTGNVTVTDDSVNGKTVVNIEDSGHTIENPAGTDLTQRANLQFKDAHLSDDSANDRTVVETFKAVTEAEYSSETEDGAYIITDGDGATIEPASEDYVEVVGDGVKTYQTLLNELFALVDVSKLNVNSYLTDGSVICRYVNNGNGLYNFIAMSDASGTYSYEVIYRLNGTNSDVYVWRFKNDGSTLVTPYSSTVVAVGTKLTLYYGNKKAVVDLQTTANRCWYDSNTTVKQKIDSKANLCTSFSTEASFELNSTSKDYTVLHDGLYCLTMMSGSSNAHDVSIFCGSTAISGDYLSYRYQKLNSQVPLKKGTIITFYGASGDGVVINYGQ